VYERGPEWYSNPVKVGAMSKSIQEWHEEVFNLLMEYRNINSGFTFAPRTKDDKEGRFRSGLWFQGTDTYLFVGLTALGDAHNKTKTIGFVVAFKDGDISRSYVEVVFGDDNNRRRVEYFRKVLNLFGMTWQEGKYKYSKDLPMQGGLKQTLYSFLDQYWAGLHAIMSAQPDFEKLVVTEDHFTKYIEKRQAVMRRGPISIPDDETIENDEDEDIEVDESLKDIPLNLILYGPPGTGKTYKLRTEWLPRFMSSTELPESRESKRNDFVSNASWWEVIAAAIAISGKASISVDGIYSSQLIQKKLAISSNNNPRATLWSNLMTHTSPESKTVGYSRHSEPHIFDKNPDSTWMLVSDWKVRAEDLAERIDALSTSGSSTAESRRYEFVTFHQSYGYEEFVEGLRPISEDGSIRYEVVPGTFLRICRRARLDPVNRYAIFIDEINRGNISRIFGELITLVETDKRVRYDHEGKRLQGDSGLEVTLPYSGSLFGVPANVHIIGTMNTADRSIALLDMALRRRFEFEEVVPDPDIIKGSDGRGWIEIDDGDPLQLPELLRSINRRINYFLGRDLMIGHAYLDKVRNIQDLHKVFAKKLIPLLQEYFYADWEKIRFILADHPEQRKNFPDEVRAALDGIDGNEYLFIISKKLVHSSVFGFGSSDQEDPWEYQVNPALFEGTLSPWAYRKIYSL